MKIGEDWGIFEFKYYEDPEDEDGIISAEITDIVINNSLLKIGNYNEIYDDAMTEDPKRVIKFLFDQVFY